MLLNIIYLIIGLALILWGANALTDGSSAIAKKWGVSDLVIGLTVVALRHIRSGVDNQYNFSPQRQRGNGYRQCSRQQYI